jgi:exodeoxyribonuclease-3
VKVATFNINNINKRLESLLDWLAKTQPDVACLQELKAEHAAFPARRLATLGYKAVWQGGGSSREKGKPLDGTRHTSIRMMHLLWLV